METLIMSREERDQLTIMAGVREQELTLVQASELMAVSYRQSKRNWRRYQTEGDARLVHRLRGPTQCAAQPARAAGAGAGAVCPRTLCGLWPDADGRAPGPGGTGGGSHQPAEHETLLGRLPLASRLARVVLQQVRPWIEPAQFFEKNQLDLGKVSFNSLRFTWVMAVLADAVVLLRAQALLGRPPRHPLLADLLPLQLSLELKAETTAPLLPMQNENPQNA
jgi:hypothetical protein